MKSIVKRAAWIALALLFVVTGLGVGIYGFWQATHQPSSSTDSSQANNNNYIKCKKGSPVKESTGKLAGTKLAGFTPTGSTDILQCTDLKVGTGAVVTPSSKITANYTGAVASTGVIFQSSLDNGGQPFTTTLDKVIPGWTTGIPGMKVGGERRLLIPAIYAYGANPPPGSGIPANADLVFDITLIAAQ
jgi:FKBP-type peptidyl-prolyl cis-trans isomerase